MVRGALLIAMVFVLGWHRRRGKVEAAFPFAATLAGGALASLAWNGHAAAGEGASGALRLAAGLVHLLAAGGWVAAVLVFLGLLLRREAVSGSGHLRTTHDLLHGFSTLGTVFVAALIVSGITHYGHLTAWSLSTLLESTYGNLLLVKLALFGGMLGLGALHRWTLVPRLGRALESADPVQEVRALRQSVAAEAALAILILIAGGISLGTGMQITGLDRTFVQWILTDDATQAWWLVFALVAATLVLGTFMSNTAAANLLLPIGISLAMTTDAGIHVIHIALAIALVASVGMALPISTPPNAMAYAYGDLRTRDLVITGGSLGLIAALLVIFGCGPVLRFWGVI